jgi:hypothetical protein
MTSSRYTKETLSEAIASSQTWAEACRKVGVKPATGAQTYLKKKADFWSIDSSHFLGRSWDKGLLRPATWKSIDRYLALDGPHISSGKLKAKLLRAKILSPKCSMCLLETWMGQPIPIELDHINGNNSDNRIENLRIVCPNCHSQTSTYCRRKPRTR